MKRRIFSIPSALSLLTCVAIGMLWVRSYQHEDVWTLRSDKHSARLLVWDTGGVRWFAEDFHSLDPSVEVSDYTHLGILKVVVSDGGEYRRLLPALLVPQETFAGFAWTTVHQIGFADSATLPQSDVPFNVYMMVLRAPCWFLTLPFTVLPAVWFWKWQCDRLAKNRGLCRKCGYDLRASKERCPECGTAIQEGRVKTEVGRKGLKAEGDLPFAKWREW